VNNHTTIVAKEYQNRTGYMPRGAWVVWVDLMAEAISCGLKKRQEHLLLILDSGPTVNGWGTMRLVEAMRGEVKPDGPAPAAFVGIMNGQQPVAPSNVVQAPRKGLLARLRGK
jgi:hypothetical protein